jgi:hypothetical protein
MSVLEKGASLSRLYVLSSLGTEKCTKVLSGSSGTKAHAYVLSFGLAVTLSLGVTTGTVITRPTQQSAQMPRFFFGKEVRCHKQAREPPLAAPEIKNVCWLD